MASETFNKGADYFGLQAAINPLMKVKSSAVNPSLQTTQGENTFGDVRAVDAYGDTASPSAEYDIIADMTEATFPHPLGTCAQNAAIGGPVVLGSVTITTTKGVAPTCSVQGEKVHTGATTLRDYSLPPFQLTSRHRAQDFLCTKSGTTYTPIMAITKGQTAADPADDYGLETVTASFPVTITKATPKGEVLNYDIHGGVITASYTMNWYAATEPTIALTAAAIADGWVITAPKAESNPENGYTQYTWTASRPFTGAEHTAQGNG